MKAVQGMAQGHDAVDAVDAVETVETGHVEVTRDDLGSGLGVPHDAGAEPRGFSLGRDAILMLEKLIRSRYYALAEATMATVTLNQIRRCLERFQAFALPRPENTRSRAAVALVLAGAPDDLNLAFIRRTVRDDDPWSGQMALPGGRADTDDETAVEIAIRETSEEVGVRLTPELLLGALADQEMRPRGQLLGILSPRIFYLGPDLSPFTLDPEEVAEAYWIPVAHLYDSAQLTTTVWEHEGHSIEFPGIGWQQQVIWGLTYRVLRDFAELIEHPLPEALAV